MRTVSRWILATGALLACAGCGFKGPLYLPERNATVVTHRAAAPQGQPQTQGAKGKQKSQALPASPTPPP